MQGGTFAHQDFGSLYFTNLWWYMIWMCRVVNNVHLCGWYDMRYIISDISNMGAPLNHPILSCSVGKTTIYGGTPPSCCPGSCDEEELLELSSSWFSPRTQAGWGGIGNPVIHRGCGKSWDDLVIQSWWAHTFKWWSTLYGFSHSV